MHKRRLQQLSVGLIVSAGLHLALIGSLRPVQISSWTPRPQPVVTVRMVAQSPATSPHRTQHTGDVAADAGDVAARLSLPVTGAERPLSAQPPLSVLAAFVESDYASVETLAQRPAPASDVIIAYPNGPDVVGQVRVYLTLFVDENGAVVRVEAEDSDVPVRFIEAAKAAFRSAPFIPGQTTGGAVRSKIRIEVTFDSNER
jgi:outer membrane biosynthesis protein TonB